MRYLITLSILLAATSAAASETRCRTWGGVTRCVTTEDGKTTTTTCREFGGRTRCTTR